MCITKLAAAAALILAVSGSALGSASLAGVWRGKIKVDRSKIPPLSDPQMKKTFETQMSMISKMSISLNLKKNGTFAMQVMGIAAPGAKPSGSQTGKWSVKGTSLTLAISASAASGGSSKVFAVAKNGKSFSTDVYTGTSIVFTR
jgi:hypothetical protein